MAIEEALTTLLAGVAGGRRHWETAPQGTSAADGAYLVLNRISGVRDYNVTSASGLVASRFQVDAYAETYTAARNAALAAVAALSGFSGTTEGVVIHGIFVEGPVGAPAAAPGEVSHLSRQRLDAIVHHVE